MVEVHTMYLDCGLPNRKFNAVSVSLASFSKLWKSRACISIGEFLHFRCTKNLWNDIKQRLLFLMWQKCNLLSLPSYQAKEKWIYFELKVVSSKRSGNHIVLPNICLLSLNYSYLFIFLILLNCAKFEQDWTKLILVILKRSPFEFRVDHYNQKTGNDCLFQG